MQGEKVISRDDIIGKLVVDSEASIIGRVKDFAITLEKGEVRAALLVEVGKGIKPITVELSSIKNIRDVVLLSKQVTVEKKSEEAIKQSYMICPKCGSKNPPYAKYCVNCGLKLE